MHDVDTKKIISVTVKESLDKPVFFRSRAYKRVGDTSQKINSSEIRKLAKESGPKVYWDEDICESAALSDIDWEFVKEKFVPLYEECVGKNVIGKPVNLLMSLDCIKSNKPTNAGILLFGSNPQSFFRNSYIALARYKGAEVSAERLDYREFAGNIFKQVDACNAYILEHTSMMSKLEPGQIRRQDIPEYGRFSIRELVTNAVCHRDHENQHTKIIIMMFSDKIRFYNPGGLPEDITPENITEKQFSRNPVLAKVLTKVEYIESLGEGWDKIIKEHKEHPLKPTLSVIDSDRFTTSITIFSTKNRFEEQVPEPIITIRRKKIIGYMKEHEKITRKECMNLLSISKDTAFRELDFLQEKGMIKRMGKGRNVYYVFA